MRGGLRHREQTIKQTKQSQNLQNSYDICQNTENKSIRKHSFVSLIFLFLQFFNSKCRLILHGELRRGDKTGAVAAANGLGTKQEHHGHEEL